MKNTLKIFTLIAALLTMAACEKDNENPVNHERDITYTIAPAASAIDNATTTTIHLETEAEWQELLDRFCDYAEEGSEVTFYNANHKVTKSATKDATTFSTSDREAMKRWMAQMEDEGLTVTVTYDPATGTWNGTAYATAPQPQEGDCYTGVLVYVQQDYYSDYQQYSYWGLKVSEDSVLRLSRGGVYLTTNQPLTVGDTTYYAGSDMGTTVTLCGTLYSRWGAYGDYFVLVLDGGSPSPQGEPPLPVYIGEKDGYRMLITLDEEHHRMYCNSTLADLTWQGAIGGGVFDYSETDQTDGLGNPIIQVRGYDDHDHPFSIERVNSTTTVLRDLGYYSTDNIVHNLDEITLHRTYFCWETWVCDTMGFNIVIHLNVEGDVHYTLGYSSSPFYVDCVTYFGIGEFYPDQFGNGWGTMTYTDTGREVEFIADHIDQNTVSLTLADGASGCLTSYVFHRIIRAD